MDSFVFTNSGPKHMMVKVGSGSSPATMINVNWDSHEHRRCIAACVVNGIYAMESDEYWNRMYTGEALLAPAWWESFNFRRLKTLRYECECLLCETKTRLSSSSSVAHRRPCSIYGAILEHVPPTGTGRLRHRSAPRFIVAFRGTIFRPHQHQHQQEQHTVYGDMHLNFLILVNKQHGCGRFHDARKEVGRLLDSIAYDGRGAAGADVWLVGHSLGASIALNVGRDMATKGWYLPTFLFNPPQVSLAPSISMLPQALRRFAKRVVYPTSYAVKAALGSTVLKRQERDMEALFQMLAPWVPELYVHERDIICQGFIDYFEQRHKMLDRLRPVAEVAMKLSLRDMLISFHSTDPAESSEDQRVRPHLLPSARLWKNSSYHYAHGLEQWWKPDSELRLSSRRYSDRGAEAQFLYG